MRLMLIRTLHRAYIMNAYMFKLSATGTTQYIYIYTLKKRCVQ